MFGKGNFDGQYRTTPTVSIRGASKHENREQLLKRAHEDRVSREADRRKAESILVIQALVRGFLARRRVRRMARDLVTSLHREMAGDREGGALDSLHRLGARLLRCYEASRDQAVFAWYSQVCASHEWVELDDNN